MAGQANWAEKEPESSTAPFPSSSVPMHLLFLARLIPSPPFASLVLITESATTRLELFLILTLLETILLPLLVVAEDVLCLWWDCNEYDRYGLTNDDDDRCQQYLIIWG